MQKEIQNWYSMWFDTPYYHILYKDRNDEEAQMFIDTITDYLNLPEQAKILDLACGKGRHAIYLNTLGYDVTGIDLSKNSIQTAQAHENETLHFKVHDMREPFDKKYDAIFNLFTSFGYFENAEDHLSTLQRIKEGLTAYGFAVIDFMNVYYILNHLVKEELKTVGGIHFFIKRRVENGYIFKDISFTDQGKKYHFTERVRALTLDDFESLMEQAGLHLLDIFGDYKLKKFHKTESQRLIMVFK